MADYYTLLTNDGIAYENDRKARGLPIKLSKMSVGDGNGAVYNPDATAKTLKREVWRGDINSILQDVDNPSWLVLELTLPDDVGGFYVREAGVWTDTGILYAILKYPESYKPILGTSGSAKEFYLKAIFQTSNAANVVLQVDESIVKATRTWVIDYVKQELSKLDSKQSVRAATTANITLSGTQTVDGVVLVVGDRVLVKNQATASQNGIYVVATGAWLRAADANTSEKVTPQLTVGVEQGTANSDSFWFIQTDAPITLGTTALSFAMAYGRTGVAAGSYQKVTVDSAGRVTGGSNPSSLAGFGILDAFTKAETAKTVSDAIAALVGSAPSTLDQINELAAAINNDPNFAVSMMAELAKKAALESPKFTGVPESPTPAAGSVGQQVANMSALAAAISAASRAYKSTVIGVSTSLTLKPEQAGNAVQFNASGLTLTLPTVASVGNGATFVLRNPPASAQTLLVASSGTFVEAGVTAVNAILKGGEWVELAASGGSWFVTKRGKLKEVAELDSPVFTGTPEVPLRATSDRSAAASSTQFVANVLASLGLGTSDLADLETGIDCNTLNLGGAFQVNGVRNGPPGHPSGILSVVGTNAQNYTHQLFFPQGTNKMFHRCSYGVTNGIVTWRDWDENPDLTTVKALLQASRRYYSGAVVGVSSARTLTAAQTGFVFNVTAAVAVKLPAAADAGSGGTYTIRNVSAGNVTITLTSGEIYVKGSTATSLVLSPNEWVDLQASDANYVVAMRGKLGEVAETESPAFTGEVKIKGGNVLRMINDSGQNGVIQRLDNGSYYLLLTDTGDANGNFNALRPLQIELPTGLVRLNQGATVAAPGDDDNSTRAVNSAWVKKKTDAAAPPGKVAHFATTSPPAGWLKRNGGAYSRTSYAALFSAIGTKFGAGDGSTTFNVPDDRELMDRAWTDGLNAADAGRELFSAQAGQIESHIHTGTATSSGDHDHGLEGEDVGGTARVDTTGQATVADAVGKGTTTGYGRTGRGGAHTHPVIINATGGIENRVANRAYLACIKY